MIRWGWCDKAMTMIRYRASVIVLSQHRYLGSAQLCHRRIAVVASHNHVIAETLSWHRTIVLSQQRYRHRILAPRWWCNGKTVIYLTLSINSSRIKTKLKQFFSHWENKLTFSNSVHLNMSEPIEHSLLIWAITVHMYIEGFILYMQFGLVGQKIL